MLELKELKEKYIEYSEEITEDIFNKILNRAKEFAREVCQNQRTYGTFNDDSFDSFRLNKFFRFSGGNYSYGVDNNRQDAKKIKVSDILGEETKFKVGKWYKYNDWYIKLKEITHANTFIASDYIDNEKIYAGNLNRFTCGDADFQKVLLTDLSEIQQYLPDGHSDKIFKELIKVEEPKPLTVDDLVEGEIYKAHINGNVYLFRAINKEGGYNLCLIISSKNPELFRKAKDVSWIKIELPTSEETKWFMVCEKQDEFISKEELSKYDSEGNLIKMKEYVKCETQEQWDFVLSKFNPYNLSQSTFDIYKSIGINLNTGEYTDSNWYDKEGYKKITFQEWLDLNCYTFTGKIANKFNIGDEVKVCSMSEDLKGRGFLNSLRNEVSPIWGVAGSTGIIKSFKEYAETIYYELDCFFTPNIYISEDCLKLVKSCVAPKKSKEMQLSDLKNPIFNVGDKVRVIADSLRELNDSWTDGNNTGYKKGYVGIITDIGSTSNYEVNAWCYLEDSVSGISCNLLELVEPAKSKVDRNVYYEVETQEQYNEILDCLESKGEVLYDDARKLKVNNNWKYVVFDLGTSGSWALYCGKKDLLKAEFQFKDKPETQPIKTGMGLGDLITQYPYQYEYKTIDLSSVWDALMNPPTQNSREELKQESKVQLINVPKI